MKMGKRRSSSSESSGSTSSSSTSTSSAASGHHHKFNSEKRRSCRSEDNKRNSSARRHDNVNNRRGKSRSNSRQRNNSDGRKGRIQEKITDQRVDRSRVSSHSNERHRRSSGDRRRDKRRSNSMDKKRARILSSDDRRRARKRSSSDDRRRQRKRSNSNYKIMNWKRSNSDDSPSRSHSRYGSTDDRRNRIQSHSNDRRKERRQSRSGERNQDKKRYRKESRSSDRRNDESKINSHSSDRSLKLESRCRFRSGSEDSIKNAKNMKRKSFDIKNRDESINKKSRFDEQSKNDERNSRKSKEKNVIISSIPCKWDRVDDTSREGESDDLIKNDINKENLDCEVNKCVASVKSDYESGKITICKAVAEENKPPSNKKESDVKDTIVKTNKFIISNTLSSRTPKTSDTYWNKYADKFGIIIDDPKYLADYNENVKKRKLSPVEVHRRKKGRNEETIDNVVFSDQLGKDENNVSQNEKKELAIPSLKKPVLDPISTKTGGAYIPPARLKMMQDQITDKSSAAYQRLAWEALKKSINGLVNKVNVSNIGIIVRELFKENIVRGRGLLCRALMQAQAFSPTFTHVYAAMVAVLNTKFPQIGELLLHRLVLQLRRGVRRNDKNSCMASCRFIGHLSNQQVAHEVVALEILTMLLEKAKDLTDESEVGDKSRKASVELAIAFLKECGMKLSELTPKGLMIVMETLRNILHEGKLDSRFQYMVEVLMAIKKGGFKDYPAVLEELDLVEEEDQFTHVIELDGKLDTQEMLNVFKVDTEYEENEAKYKELKASILGEDSGGEGSSESGAENDDEESEAEKGEDDNIIIDCSETNLVAFRRTVYLIIQSSLDVDECAHKLLKGDTKPGCEEELCNMIIDCCAQQRTYMKFYGLLAQRFCMLNKIYQQYFEKIFKDAYETCHRLEIEKLRNVAKLFSHLFFSDSISWESFSCIRLNQDETTSSSRVFLKILFEELGDFMGLCKLNERLRDPTLTPSYEGLLPRDNPANTRFTINFFTTIGLGGLTDDLREFLRSQPKPTAVVAPVPQTSKDESSDSSSSSSDSSSDDSSSSSDSTSSEDSSSDSDSSRSDSSSSNSSISDSSNSDSSSSEDSSSNESYKKSSSWKSKKKLLKKSQMEQRKASEKKHGSKDKKKAKKEKHTRTDSSKILKYKVIIDERKPKKLSKNERNNLVFENKKVAERNSDRRRSINNSKFNRKRNESSDESNNEDTRARRVGESSKNIGSGIEEKQQKRYKRRKNEHSSDREGRIRSRPHSREKSNDPQEKCRKTRDERRSRNSNENSKVKQLEDERRSKVSEGSESSESEEKDSKKHRSKEVETEKTKNNRDKEDKKDKRKDLKNDSKKKEKQRDKDDSNKEDETKSHRRRRNKEYESKSKGSRDKDREKKEDRRSRRLSQV